MATVQDILTSLNETAPFHFQESYDNSGLLVGSPNLEVTGITVALDCTEAVIEDAINSGANLIVTHHPILFKGIKRLTGSNYVERTIIKAIQHNIALIAIHTNLDAVEHGVNGIISDKLKLVNRRILSPKSGIVNKLVVFVPVSHQSEVLNALFEAGAGTIGNYDSCSFQQEGNGTFRALEGANPFVGKLNELETVAEMKLEVIVSTDKLSQVISAMKKVHPYEEVPYDIFPLNNTFSTVGSGMVGDLPVPMPVMDFLNEVKKVFGCGAVRYTSPTKTLVSRIAVCGGSGSFLLSDAIGAQADVFLTSDFKYHEFFDAENRILIADIGHYESEQYTSEWLVEFLNKKFSTFAVRLTSVNTNPIHYL